MEIFLFIISLIPTVLGLAEILHFLKMRLFAPSKKPECFVLVVLERGEACQQLKYAVKKFGWENNDFKKLIAVPKNLSEQEIRDCRALTESYGIEIKETII